MRRGPVRQYPIELSPAGDGAHKGVLERLARNLGISAHIDFPWLLDEEAVIRELQGADVFVLPSLVEGFSASAVEATAVGFPS
jgi:glycosyltransferase involved in cell wall biosynthesis